MEIWKQINGYENKYWISSFGSIKNNKNILKPYISGSYYSIKLNNLKSRKSYLIHRLVAEHFVINAKSDINNVVDHIDNNKLNNNYYNLRWTTQSENMKSFMNNYSKKIYKKIAQLDKNKNTIKIWNSVKVY